LPRYFKKGIKGDQMFFNDSIRLTKESKQKLKKGQQESSDLVSRSQRKFELSIMIWGGICSKGLSNLVLLEGPENEFSYAQALLYYNENFN